MSAVIRTASVVGVGSIGLALVGAVSASAVPPVEGCGDAPTGATLTRTGDVCQLDFSTAGDFSWTVPSGLTGIYAMLAGGGGGAWAGGQNGYAGSGGDVVYATLTGTPAGTVVPVTVGAGGASGDGDQEPGEDTSIDAGSPVIASGGNEGNDPFSYCYAGSWSVYTGNGQGAGGPAGPDGDDCDVAAAPGVVPSTDDDSNGDDPLAAFADLSTEFGAGGVVFTAPDPVPSVLESNGIGASVSMDIVESEVAVFNEFGADGRVIIRYDAQKTALAATGLDLSGLLAGAGALGLAGAVALVASRRRTRES